MITLRDFDNPGLATAHELRNEAAWRAQSIDGLPGGDELWLAVWSANRRRKRLTRRLLLGLAAVLPVAVLLMRAW